MDDSFVCHCVIPDAVSNATKVEAKLEFRRRTKSGMVAWNGVHGQWSITEQARFADFLRHDLIEHLILPFLHQIENKVMTWRFSAGNPLRSEDPWALHNGISLLGHHSAISLESPLCVVRRRYCGSVRKTDKLSITCFLPTAQCIGPLVHSLLKFFDTDSFFRSIPLDRWHLSSTLARALRTSCFDIRWMLRDWGMGVAVFELFFCLLENRSFQMVLKCHMWQVLKAVTMIQELPASLTDDWTWVRHFFVTHPEQEQLEDGDDDREWLQIEWWVVQK